MRPLIAWLGVAMLGMLASPAHAGDPLKPYVVLIFDTSGSMDSSTPAGLPSCGGRNTRHDHARCAVNKIVNSYGDMVFGLGRFRMTMSGTTTAATFPAGCSTSQLACDSANPATDANFELLTGLVDGNNDPAATWTNLSGNTCTAMGSDPEIWDVNGNTPLGGSLLGARRYWQGQQATDGTVLWPSNSPGFGPIANDPLRNVFLPSGEQCRPYITILLTDGEETCGGNPANAAATMLTTPVGMRNYRIETKPIGFGITPPSTSACTTPGQAGCQIEDIAHSGGEPNVAGRLEGYYAQDEAQLQLAISSILDDAIRTEVCNNLDDDCDTLVDEDFPNKGGTCDNGKVGRCRATGAFVCRADGTGTQCNAPVGPAPITETCNQQDDDCDGNVDEGLTCSGCTPTGESCNNADDDCDGRVDEQISRQCGTGTCLGTETCVGGVFQGCTAQTPTTETCDGQDNNCDGQRDGFSLQCSNLVTPGGPATDNPGGRPGSPCQMLGTDCVCHPGNKVCPANGNGQFGACVGEVGPSAEVCNGLDDDCDGQIDEGTGGADCSSNCQVGTTVCVNGQLQCNATPATEDDNCDGVDDDCDGRFDEDYVSGGACGTGQVCNGTLACVNGNEICQGTPISSESCDCADNDCDNTVDEAVACAEGASCTGKPFCQCAFQCMEGEFPCPQGRICLAHPGSGQELCVLDPCANVSCPPVGGNLQTCQVQVTTDSYMGVCVDVCSTKTCNAPLICQGTTGECVPDDCRTFPERCQANESCVVDSSGSASCVANPCFDVECADNQYCVAGQCVGSCADVDCPDGQRCRQGVCETDPCGQPCPFGQACNDSTGQCVADNCDNVNCPQGQWCNPNTNGGTCEPDPCVGTTCPDPSQVCRGGTCYDPSDFTPDGGRPERVTTGGGGGCNTTSDSTGVLTLGLALLALRSRRRATRVSGGSK